MPRVSRKQINANFLHIITKGIKDEFIFYKENYKNEYISLMDKYTDEIDEIKILSYCVMDNHTHLLIYTKEINKLSTFMKKLNIAYATYYNKNEERSGYVFGSRYYTQTIKNEMHLLGCIKYIHENPVNAGIVKKANEYKYSSYRKIEKGELNLEVIDELFMEKIDYLNYENIDLSKEEFEFIETENNDNKLKNINIEEILEKFCKIYQTSLKEIKKSNYLILKFKEYLNKEYKVSNKNICSIIGIGKNRISSIEKKLI